MQTTALTPEKTEPQTCKAAADVGIVGCVSATRNTTEQVNKDESRN